VRMEWEGEAGGDEVKGEREKRELAFWVVVGVGRVGKTEVGAAAGT